MDRNKSTDTIIVELLGIMERMDSKLDAHIQEEMKEFRSRMEEIHGLINMVVHGAFPDADLTKHKKEHEEGCGFFKRLFKR